MSDTESTNSPVEGSLSLAGALVHRFRGGLIRFGAVAFGLFILGWILRQDLLLAIKRPLVLALPESSQAQTAFYQVTDAFFLHIKLAAFIAAMLLVPYLLWELWRWLKPRIPSSYQRHGLVYLCTCGGLFSSGVLFAYLVLLPVVLHFLVAYAQGEIPLFAFTPDADTAASTDALAFAMADYVSFALRFLLGIGISFLTPMLLFSLSGLGLVNPATLARHRRLTFVVLAVGAAFLTPPDPVSMLLLTLPLYLLYELGLQAGKLVWPHREK